MHETHARRLTRMASSLGLIGLEILIALALADFLTRDQVPRPWQ
jgi:hypothetical protein